MFGKFFQRIRTKGQEEKVQQQFTQRLAKHIKKLRKAKGLTQEELSFEAKLGHSYVGHLERGIHNPRAFVLWKIAQALDMDMDEFWQEF